MKKLTILLIATLAQGYLMAQITVTATEAVAIDVLNTKSEESLPILTADQNTFYFVRAFDKLNDGGANAGQDIWHSKRDSSGNWQTPVNLKSLNNKKNNAVVGIGDRSLFVLNSYTESKDTERGIVKYKQKNDDWEMAGQLPINILCDGPFVDYFVSKNEQTVVVSCKGTETKGAEDLYVFVKQNDTWSEQISLGNIVNSERSEISPFLMEDQKTLFFASNGHQGYGDMDLFVTQRLDESWNNWSTPINLGEQVNSKKFEAYLSIYQDSLAYFSSSKDRGYADIYSSIINIIDSTKVEEEKDTIPQIVEIIDIDEPEETMPEMEKIIVQEPFYLVQLLALFTPDVPKRTFFKELDIQKISMFEGKDGLNRFSYGHFSSKQQALEYMKALRNEGYSDAFVRGIEKYAELSIPKNNSIIISFSD